MAAVTVCSDFGAQENEICHCFHMLGYIVRKSEKVKANHSVMSDSVTLWTAAHQAPPSMELSRQEYWSWLPFPSRGSS